jgi:hypothetical protein
MRERTGKRARLTSVEFDRQAVNAVHDKDAEAEEALLKEETAKAAQETAANKEAEAAKLDAKAEAALAAHNETSEADKIEEQPVERANAKGPVQEQNKESK